MPGHRNKAGNNQRTGQNGTWGGGASTRRERIFYCQECDKWCYDSKKSAKRVARAVHHDNSHLNAYGCPYNELYWHYGHNYTRLNRTE